MPNQFDRHLTNSVIMVQPIDFGFNEQTGIDNEFQHRPAENELREINSVVNAEFEHTAKTLQLLNIETLILRKQHTHANLPDAVFPNNWFSTRANGEIHIYPMKTENRRDEVQITPLSNLVKSAGYELSKVIDLRKNLSGQSILEGTGSLIFHHPSRTIFAALSERCQADALQHYAKRFDYQLEAFETASSYGVPIYHTNVLMSCGRDFAVITESILSSRSRTNILSKLEDRVGELLIISELQMTNHFCGNILQLEDSNNQAVIALSHSAYNGFNSSQKKFLENKGTLAVCKIPTIERIGGGSTRCMLAENFLPSNTNSIR